MQQIEIIIHRCGSLAHKIKTENVYNDFSKNRKMSDFSKYSAEPEHYDDSKALVVGKKKDEI